MKRLRFPIIIAAMLCAFAACKPDTAGVGSGFSNIKNPREDQLISVYGESISITFDALAGWTAEIECEDGWAEIKNTSGSEAAGRGIIKIQFQKNVEADARSAKLYVTVQGYKRSLMATFEQSNGKEQDSMGEYLIKKMEERLTTEYLWAEEYSKLEREQVSYDSYLFTNLTKLGSTNIEDGGYYKDNSASAGKRYIYSYIQELNAVTKGPELLATYGLGIGPLFSSVLNSNTGVVCLSVGYVYRGSPAETAGLRRGDVIYQVNGITLTTDNYSSYMRELFYTPNGTYKLGFMRYEVKGRDYELVDHSVSVSSGNYGYDPVIYAAVMNNDPATDNPNLPAFKIGYLVTESFDINAQFVIEDQIQQFVDAGITDLVLDLRFNVGGSVSQSRYVSSAIVGRAHDNDIFFNAEYVDGRKEPWTFGHGYSGAPDGLTHAPELGLSRLFVIVSENTASASELLINGLRGIDFPVTAIGSCTEGKNVGMVVSNINYNGRVFEFAPITFRCSNAKGEGDYKDGIMPEEGNILNNQNNSYTDDIDNVFPYAFGNWDDFNFNYGLYFCLCDILERPRPDFRTKAAAPRDVEILSCTGPQLKPGRFGNVVYP